MRHVHVQARRRKERKDERQTGLVQGPWGVAGGRMNRKRLLGSRRGSQDGQPSLAGAQWTIDMPGCAEPLTDMLSAALPGGERSPPAGTSRWWKIGVFES
jgi:hypothetical protein